MCMADVRRIDGRPIEETKPGRNEKIADMLRELVQENDAGQMDAALVLWLRRDGRWDSRWQWPELVGGKPLGLDAIGSLFALATELAVGMIARAQNG